MPLHQKIVYMSQQSFLLYSSRRTKLNVNLSNGSLYKDPQLSRPFLFLTSLRIITFKLRNMAATGRWSLEEQERILESNRDFIIKRLDSDDVIDELIQANLISQNAAQRVQLMGTIRVEKNRIIFDQLITCGPGALEKFCEILKTKKRQSFIAEQLEKCG